MELIAKFKKWFAPNTTEDFLKIFDTKNYIIKSSEDGQFIYVFKI